MKFIHALPLKLSFSQGLQTLTSDMTTTNEMYDKVAFTYKERNSFKAFLFRFLYRLASIFDQLNVNLNSTV